MKSEYLIFNIIVIAGPLIFGSLKPFYFLDRWRAVLISSIIVGVPFIIWDSLVTGKHWMFNKLYTLDFRLVHLPIGELLFFITVPSACLFTWEMIKRRSEDSYSGFGRIIRYSAFVRPLFGLWLFATGKQYTGLVFIFLTMAIFLDYYLKTDLLFQKRFYLYVIMIILLTLIFNGYLTWRPVVLYGESYQIGFRVFTIPIEDFGYGLSLLFMCTSIYEKLKAKKLTTEITKNISVPSVVNIN
jgi:lycopene cyclase domain-containing protein